MKKGHKTGLNPKKVGLSVAIVASFYMMVLGLFYSFFGWGGALIRILASLYIGYEGTMVGILIGTLWGFIDGFIFGYIFAWIYNKTPDF